jgi:D-tyrosyl-tRNA(Tyr) deacylase
MKRVVYFFCTGPDVDHVAFPVFESLRQLVKLEQTDIFVDEQPVLKQTDEKDNEFYFVRTHRVVCHDYPRYLPMMNQSFSDFDFAGLITWHEGQNAPDPIFSVHTTGDVDSGQFGNANPLYMHRLLWALERNRRKVGLEDFRVTTEGTHWSGIVYGNGNPEMIPHFPVPIVDIEIGSSKTSWANPLAAEALAKSLLEVFEDTGKVLKNLLCVGGVHFEQGFANAVFQEWEGNVFGISHILPNHWLVSGQYESESGAERLERCLESMEGGVHGIVFHDNLKGIYKERIRLLGEKYQVPVFKHKLLSRPKDIPWNR